MFRSFWVWDIPFCTFVSDCCCCYGKSCAGTIFHWCYGTPADANVSSILQDTAEQNLNQADIFFQVKCTTYLTWNFLFSSEIGILTSTALLHRIVRQVTSDVLLQEVVYFILGEHREPETLTDINRHPLRHRLIEHCDHISDEVRSDNDIIMSSGQFCLAQSL